VKCRVALVSDSLPYLNGVAAVIVEAATRQDSARVLQK